ncbi:unnamed protein product [Closterium sp. NIES-54]
MGRSDAEVDAYEREWRAKGYVEGTKGGGEGGGGGGEEEKQEQQGGLGQAGGAGQVIGEVQGGGGVAKGGAMAQQEVAKPVVVPGEVEKGSIHAMVTSNGNAYMNWQTLLMFHTYKKVASEAGSNLRFFTRVLHRTKDDELMHLVPTVRVRPLEPKCDDWCEYPVADRPFAIQQWLESGDVKGEWIFMIETDYLFVKPVTIPPTGRAVGFPFGYIIPTYPSIHHIMIRYALLCGAMRAVPCGALLFSALLGLTSSSPTLPFRPPIPSPRLPLFFFSNPPSFLAATIPQCLFLKDIPQTSNAPDLSPTHSNASSPASFPVFVPAATTPETYRTFRGWPVNQFSLPLLPAPHAPYSPCSLLPPILPHSLHAAIFLETLRTYPRQAMHQFCLECPPLFSPPAPSFLLNPPLSPHPRAYSYYPGDLMDIPQTGNRPVLAPTAPTAA